MSGGTPSRGLPGGCALIERWRADAGGTGTSLNWFNPRTEQWRQVWVSANGVEIDIAGGLDGEGRMVLEGTIETYGEHGPRPFRGIWTPRADGSVRQRFDIRPEPDAPWQLWFDGIYRRAEAE